MSTSASYGALAFYALLGNVLFFTHGHYQAWGAWVVILGFMGSIALGAKNPLWLKQLRLNQIGLDVLFSTIVAEFGFLLLYSSGLLYARTGGALSLLELSLKALPILLVLRIGAQIWSMKTRGGNQSYRTLALLNFLSLTTIFVAKALVVRASPSPFIDVYTTINEGVDYLLSGRNPYSQSYQQIYGHNFEYVVRLTYWPATLYLLAPFKIIFGDFRVAYVLGEFFTVYCFLRLGKRLGVSGPLSWTILLLWNCFPVSLFVTEQAWTDSLLIPMAAGLMLAMTEPLMVTSGVLIGLVVAFKQYGVLLAGCSALALYRLRATRDSVNAGVIAVVVILVSFLPFVWLDWDAFYDNTILFYLNMGLRRNALSLPPLLFNSTRIEISEWVQVLLFVSVLVWASRILVKVSEFDPPLKNIARWAHALYLVHGVVFIFIGSSFCNYYYFLALFALMSSVWGLLPAGDAKLRRDILA